MNSQYGIGEEIFNDVIVIDVEGGKNKSGFGVVYIVMDKNTGFLLALKTLQKEQISLSDFRKIKKEIVPWINVSNHPNIVCAFTVELDENKRPFIIMEPISRDEYGRLTLTEFMDSEKLSEDQILKWSIQFCYAMDYVNQKGYIHGDIKPDNILISNGIVKITDFGLAKSLNDISNDYYGSPFYLAPESWDGIKNVSSEIYSFGMVMYQMFNEGTLPFDGILDEEWENFHKYGKVSDLDYEVFPHIKKCLEKDPKNRFISFSELNEVLSNYLNKKFSQKIVKPELVDIGNIKNLGRGHLAAILGDVENCKRYYEITIENSEDIINRYNYSLDLIDLKQYDDALIQLIILLKNPGMIPLDRIYYNIGKCYHEGICLYNAIEYYKKAIEVNNNDLKAHTNLGNVYKKFGLFNDALDQYNFVLKANGTFKEALVNIIDLFKRMGDQENFNEYSLKIETIESTPLIVYNKGLLNKNENILTFLTSMDTVSEEYTFQIPALIQLFEFHLSNGKWRDASIKFNEIFKLIGENSDLMVSLCFDYVKFGFLNEAIKKIDFLYEKYPNSEKCNILFKKSIIIKDFDRKESITICNNLLKENIGDEFKSEIFRNLGNIYMSIDESVALDYYLKSLQFNPENILSLVDISNFHGNKGSFFFAEEYIDKGLEIDRRNLDLLFNKARVCQDQFRYFEAISYYIKCLKLEPISKCYSFISFCFFHLKDYAISLICCGLAIRLCEDYNEEVSLIHFYCMLSFIQGDCCLDELNDIFNF